MAATVWKEEPEFAVLSLSEYEKKFGRLTRGIRDDFTTKLWQKLRDEVQMDGILTVKPKGKGKANLKSLQTSLYNRLKRLRQEEQTFDLQVFIGADEEHIAIKKVAKHKRDGSNGTAPLAAPPKGAVLSSQKGAPATRRPV